MPPKIICCIRQVAMVIGSVARNFPTVVTRLCHQRAEERNDPSVLGIDSFLRPLSVLHVDVVSTRILFLELLTMMPLVTLKLRHAA